MKKFFLAILLCVGFFFLSRAELISHFTFDREPLTSAAVGMDAISISPFAYTTGSGVYVNSTGGLTGLDLTLPAALPLGGSISLEFVFTINEMHGYIFEKEGFRLWINGGGLHARYQTSDGSSFSTFNFPNIYIFPPMGTRVDVLWTYDEVSGKASLYVYGDLVWEEVGVPGESLLWYQTHNAVIGRQMNGSGSTTPLFYDFKIYDNVGGALPVDLLEFNAIAIDELVRLEWTTSSETNNDFFEIQRSSDGRYFTPIGIVEGNGNSNMFIHYSFLDEHVCVGAYYYRLRQIDYNGSYDYSPVRSVFVSGFKTEEIVVYPNPLIAGEILNISVPEKTELFIRLYSLKGMLIYETKRMGDMHYVLTDLFRPSAVYYMEIIQNNKRLMHPLLIR